MEKINCIILTGAPGSGKTTLLNALRQKGVRCIDEPARQILAEQRQIGGDGIPETNPGLFIELMLSRTTKAFCDIDISNELVIFDRGIADNIAYAKLFDLSLNHGWRAARLYRFNPLVFFTPNWPEIYKTDDERKMSFALAASMGDNLREIYANLDYDVQDLPLCSVEERVDYLLEAVPA
ncbi:MAG: AAA family ATPase, partial [Chloroflexota bacterium]